MRSCASQECIVECLLYFGRGAAIGLESFHDGGAFGCFLIMHGKEGIHFGAGRPVRESWCLQTAMAMRDTGRGQGKPVKREDARKLAFPGIIMKKLFSKQ